MTYYSKMSDFEINGRVAKATRKIGDPTQARGKTFIHEHEDVGEFKNICIGWKEYDPCNNPADAWPIIVENEICIEFENDEVQGIRQVWAEASIGHFTQDNFQSYPDANPLRAAMIVFLMMKESEQCSS